MIILRKRIFQTWGCVWKVPEEYSQSLDDQEIGYNRLQGFFYRYETKFLFKKCKCKNSAELKFQSKSSLTKARFNAERINSKTQTRNSEGLRRSTKR